MNPNINKPMYSDRYGSDVRNSNKTPDKENAPAKGLPFENPYDAPGVALEGEKNSGLNEHNYFGKSRINKNSFKEAVDESPKEINGQMTAVLIISILLLVTIGISILVLVL